MRHVEEMIVRMGMLGWIGYMLAFGALLLYYRLWMSTRPQEVQKLKQSVAEADRTIKSVNELLRATVKERDELKEAHRVLHAEYMELRGQFSELNKAYGKLGDMVATLREDLKAEQRKRDDQYLELLRAKAKTGDL
jgi:septal ring factor EnvC (AmiA/AmiB activator)